MKTDEKIKIAESYTQTEISDEQRKSGNYQKGMFTFQNIEIVIENPKNSYREGMSEKGKRWRNKMLYTYGYINNTIGSDGDPLDVFLGESMDKDFNVYVIDQIDPETGLFDEHKIMLGFKNANQAMKAYKSCYDKDWKGFGDVTQFSMEDFEKWAFSEDLTKIPVSKLVNMDIKNQSEDDRIKLIKLEGEVLEGKTLADLQAQAGELDSFDTLILEIASPGGSVSEGLEIMIWLDYLSALGKNIVTVVTANAYSIASLIMLSADHRLISKHGKIMVHNPMVPELKYANANELEGYANELRNLEAVMYELYMFFTGMNQAQIKELMDNETYLDPKQAIEIGFADMEIDVKPKPYVMVVNNQKEVNMSKTINKLHQMIAKINGTKAVNQVYYDSEGGTIDINQNDPSTYQKGDRTNVENGQVKLADGSVLVIKDYVIADIVRVQPMPEPAPIDPNAVPTTEPAPAVPAPVVPTEPAPAPVPTPEAPKEDEPKAEEVITNPITEPTIEPEKPEAQFNEGPAPKKEEVKTVSMEQYNALSAKYDELEKKMQAFEAKADEKIQAIVAKFDEKMEAKALASEKFENTVTEMFDTLASSTVSNFKPQAKAKVEAPAIGKNSIFARAKAQRGL